MNFDKFPIVIIGVAPRCGSTPYVELLEQKLKIRAFREPWHPKIYNSDKSYLRHYEEYIKYKKTTNKYIVKFWLHDLQFRSPYLDEIENGYKTLLMRKDVVSQLALAIPMCVLYEMGIWAAQLFIKHTQAPKEDEASASS